MIEDPKVVTAYDETIVAEKLKPFIELTDSLGGDGLKEQVEQRPDPLSVVDDG